MNRYIIDSWIWVEYFEGKSEKVKDIIESENNEIYTTQITLSEIISVSKRKNKNVDEIFKSLIYLSKIYSGDLLFYKFVGELHSEIKKKIKDFGLADAFVLATARRLNAKIITGDPHFKGFKEAILLQS